MNNKGRKEGSDELAFTLSGWGGAQGSELGQAAPLRPSRSLWQ